MVCPLLHLALKITGRRLLTAHTLAISIFALPALAGSKEAADAVRHHDYASAYRELVPLAERGDVFAQRALAVMFEKGMGIDVDYAAAVRWYRKASEKGDAESAHGLALLYKYGRGVPQDYVESIKLLKIAVEHGDSTALPSICHAYEDGTGVSQSSTKAFDYCLRAAETDEPSSQHYIGNYYWAGRGVQKDVSKAVEWLSKSANQGYGSSAGDLATIYFRGDLGKSDLRMACFWSKLAFKNSIPASYHASLQPLRDKSCAGLSDSAMQMVDQDVKNWNADPIWVKRRQHQMQEELDHWIGESAIGDKE